MLSFVLCIRRDFEDAALIDDLSPAYVSKWISGNTGFSIVDALISNVFDQIQPMPHHSSTFTDKYESPTSTLLGYFHVIADPTST